MQVLTCGSNVTTSEHAIPADMRPGGVNLNIYIYIRIYMYVCMSCHKYTEILTYVHVHK